MSTQKKPLFPGVQYLGKSVNLLNKESDPGSRALLQSLTNDEIDRLDAGSGKLVSRTRIAEDISEATKEYSAEIGIEGSYGAFSAKAELQLSKKVKERSRTKIVMMTRNFVSSKLSIKSRKWKLEKEFEAKLNDPSHSPKELFEVYGTHITLGVNVGGRFTGIFSSKENTKESEESLEVSAEASYGGVTATGKYLEEEARIQISKEINQSYVVKGGQSDFKMALETNKTTENYTAWAKSVDSHPGFFSFTELKPIWELAIDASRQTEIEKAFKWMFTKKSLENLERFIFEDKTGNKNSTLTVPDGYKILSGGANIEYGDGMGKLLTACYPLNSQNWSASQKDHEQTSLGFLTLYALAVYDPFDFLSVHIWSLDSESSPTPSKKITASDYDHANGYQIVGGGSKVNYLGNGNLLTGSYPYYDEPSKKKLGWHSTSSQVNFPDSATITSYYITLNFKENGPYTIELELFDHTSELGGRNITNVGVGSGYSLVGGGAMTSADGKGRWAANFLTSSYPEGKKWIAKSKDHFLASKAILKVVAIGMKITDK